MICRILSRVRNPVLGCLLLLNCLVSGCKLVGPQTPGNEAVKQAQKFGDEVAAGAQTNIVEVKKGSLKAHIVTRELLGFAMV